jgi:maltose alpha-D-glucosyltransferase / alpha-amylase
MIVPGSATDPLWFKDAIIYELHVKTFFDSNNDGIGDFAGLIQKLDYLHNLGITCLWLLPFFPSPLRDDGYDIADYYDVHPAYGTLDDFRAFLKAAHDRNLQVMIELVINHTSDQHPWFQAARKAPPGSPEREFYVWSDTDGKYRDARIIFTDTEQSNWTWDPEAKAYFWHRFFSHQPDLNYDNPAVLEEILKAMCFWLDMGVDGLRLDAIPYLVEREGTSCENLPETHVIVKKIRSYLDERYANRMILAEANQWPTDVREYFGDGDECHMAFHFPLMPRLFMALRLEDRHPVTDIIAQTPDIPENCQWGLFLRNHDELTLEMVTDEERDYMYLAYSADPQMRINIGIRRRLAPLIDNSRRRIELLNSLLYSFPGTPILYYGDEIGMGDNIYLGDRNGVRTPMQWSADRNAGFSRSNPARLYSPVIMDPVFGYQSINVEAQQEDPSSLLNWMRNMIALRKLFQVFGRGKIAFLHPENRKILAYLRSYGDDRILCVANFSRFAQPAELDLSDYAGMTPVEMFGYVEFPGITRNPYALTLAPYGFLWFELHGEPEKGADDDRGLSEEVPLPVLQSADPWGAFFDNRAPDFPAARLLRDFLLRQRWFGGRSRIIRAFDIEDWGGIPDSPAALVITSVHYEEGPSEYYFIPVSLVIDENRRHRMEEQPAAIIGRVMVDNMPGIICDASYDEDACRALLRVLERKAEFPTKHGWIQGETVAAQDHLWDGIEDLTVHQSRGEQSNSSVLFGNRLILKLFRRLQPGVNPDYEIGRFLTEKAGFGGVPPHVGAIEYTKQQGALMTAAMLQELVQNQGDGWNWTLDELRRYYETCGSMELSTSGIPDESVFNLSEKETLIEEAEHIGIYYDSAVALGRITAGMHLALASSASDPDFCPEPVSALDLERLADGCTAHAAAAFDTLRDHLARMPEDLLENASLVLSLRRRLLRKITEFGTVDRDWSKIRIHGDYHLGQVLRQGIDFVILDFEGEPARPIEERRARQSPLKDVAGMLRSFSYAAQTSLLSYAERGPDELDRLEPCARYWERVVSAAFLQSYRAVAGNALFLPRGRDSFRRLLELYLLEKALYELAYELDHRPSWVRIPLWGILSLESGAMRKF